MSRIEQYLGPEIVLLLLLASLAVPLTIRLGNVLTVFTFDMALFLMYTGWLVQLVRGLAPRPRLQALGVIALPMLAWFALSAVLGANLLASVNGLLFYVRMYLIYLYVANNLRTARQARYFVALLLALIAIEGIVSIIQYVTKSNFGSLPDLIGTNVQAIRVASGNDSELAALLFRARGTLGYDTNLAHWFELLLPVPVSLWLGSKEQRQQMVYASLTALGFVGLIFTFTRGAWMGFALAMGVLFVLLARKTGLTREYWLVLGRVAVLFVILVLILWMPIRTRLSAGAMQDSLDVRARLNEVAIRMISAEPLIGVGLDSFATESVDFGASREFSTKLTGGKPHNMYLAVAAESGLIGLGLFVAFLAVIGVVLYRTQMVGWSFSADVGRGLLAGFCGVLVHNLIAWGLLSYMVFPLFWSLLGLASSLRWLSTEVSKPR